MHIYCIEALLYTDVNYFGIVINRKHNVLPVGTVMILVQSYLT